MKPPYSAYAICGTPRSGSTLLCEMLASSGVAGRPNSFYRTPSIAYWADRWGVPYPDGLDDARFDREYLEALRQYGTAGTGILGIRIMWSSMAEAATRLQRVYGGTADIVDRFEQAFGPTLFIHLSRLDKVAQAVSLFRAERSGLWHLAADGSVYEGAEEPLPVTYDATRLAQIVSELDSDDAAWNAFFAERQLHPIRLTYETMTAAPHDNLSTILAALGRDPKIAQTVSVGTSKMSDATSREWAERFRAESRRRA